LLAKIERQRSKVTAKTKGTSDIEGKPKDIKGTAKTCFRFRRGLLRLIAPGRSFA
jgi:hypothetical protein